MIDNINKILIDEKIASNDFQAANVATGLKMWECKTVEDVLQRARLYRKWRPKTDKKNEVPSWQAYYLAIAGIDPDNVVMRQIDLFEVKS